MKNLRTFEEFAVNETMETPSEFPRVAEAWAKSLRREFPNIDISKVKRYLVDNSTDLLNIPGIHFDKKSGWKEEFKDFWDLCYEMEVDPIRLKNALNSKLESYLNSIR